MSAQSQPHHYQAYTTATTAMATMSSQGYHQPTTVEEVRTLWIGDLQYWVEESYLHGCFAHTGEVVSIKIIRNKITGQPEGYGFIEFVSHAAAERILQTYNGTLMPGTELTFRLNWASFGIGERRPDAGPEHSIFVGDLAPDVTDYLLQETFRAQYPSVRGAKVVTDPNTGRSKGYGFVKFSDEAERNRAMTEMNGVYCSTRPMRISAATPKKTTAFQPYPATKAAYPVPLYSTPVPTVPADSDVNNTTIFVGNLDPNVTEEELKQTFLQFGEIVYVKIPVGKGCGFVQFGTRASAEDAIQKMQGKMIGQQIVRISWGRSPTAKQDLPGSWGQQVDPSQWSAYYGYGQGYDAYTYGATQDPSLYAYGSYPGYAQYPQQVDGAQDVAAMAGAVPAVEQREELYDPLATPDVDKLNAAYLSIHGSTILGRPLWLKTSSLSQQA
ncbi:polyadenylate-binding protein RBP47B' isoform X2 [Corylus avellana]|uniref:polyadenylate-binding protein RBP47B' isoform X2 n=1 Tax=Corylus avellana TaxID=13451 RepID=UPI00286B92C9|nr:polyadenylate-binding protein RBP47B' isoform X2 [Corylus avellana]